jgi:hypothetical protein
LESPEAAEAATDPGWTTFPQEQTHNEHARSRDRPAARLRQGIKRNYLSGNLNRTITDVYRKGNCYFR